MSQLLWILQVLLALHTAAGAIWKFSNPVQAVPSLNVLPPSVWIGMGVLELLCVVGLILPLINARFGKLVPISAGVIGATMILFTGIHLTSGETDMSPIIYWVVVAAICAFIAYARAKRSSI